MVEKNNINAYIKEYVNNFKKLPKPIKIILTITFIVIVIGIGIIFYLGVNPNYKILYKDLSDEEIAKVTKVLEDEKIKYKILNNNILIAENHWIKAKIKISNAGVTIGSGTGFELFDKVNFGMSEEERKINYQRALQAELERTINKIPGIEKSRVHLLISEKKLFEDEEENSKASVYLKIKPGFNISEQQIIGIQNLVANSVNNLKPGDVIVLSTDGKILSNIIDKDENIVDVNLNRIKTVEEYYRKKIQSFLDNIVGVNNSTVRVSVNMQFYKTEISKEIYKPNLQQPAIKNELVLSETTNNNEDTQVQSNTNLMSINNKITKQNRQVNYEIDKEYQKTIIQPGEIKNIYIAVVLNGEYTKEYIENLKESISVGMGLNFKRGDMIDIKSLNFNKNQLALPLEKQKFDFFIVYDFLKNYLPVIIGILFIFIILNNTKNLIKNAAAETRLNNNGKEVLDEEKILKLAKENPNEVAKIIKNWL